MSLIVSGLGVICSDMEEKNKFSRCRFVFKNGRDEQYVGLKIWHSDIKPEVLQYLKKGKEIFISGRLDVHDFNEKRYVDVVVNDFTFTRQPPKQRTDDEPVDDQSKSIPF